MADLDSKECFYLETDPSVNCGFENVLSLFLTGASNFPKAECTVEDEFSRNTLLGTRPYLVAYVDKRFTTELVIRTMLPYVYVFPYEADKEKYPDNLGYGWMELNHSNFVDNLDHTIGNNGEEYVLGFAPLGMNSEHWSDSWLDKIAKAEDDDED